MPKPMTEVAAGDTVYGRSQSGELVQHRVTSVQANRCSAVRIRARGRNVITDADAQVLRILRAKRGHLFPYPCSTSTCSREGAHRGLCIPCYRKAHRTNQLPDTWARRPRYRTEIVPARHLARDDLLVVLDNEPDLGYPAPTLTDDGLFGIPVTEKMAWLFGATIGDGTVSESDVRVCAFGQFGDQVANAFREVFAIEATPHWSAGLIACSVSVASLLRSLGYWRRGEDKRVPEVVWSWPRNIQQQFCAGYAAADGYFDPRPGGGQRYDSCSRRLIDEVRTLHMQAGHRVTNITTNNRAKPIVIKGKTVKNAKPLHNFVVSSTDPEPYSAIMPPIVNDLTGGHFGLRVVLGVDDVGVEEVWGVRTNTGDNVVVDGVPIWVPSVVAPAPSLSAVDAPAA